MALVKIEGVSFTYEGNRKPSLLDVTLEVNEGDFVLIVGRSGSGKSTLLRLLNGLIPHFYQGEMKGRVLVDGVDTRKATVAQLARKVGLVFQNPEHMFFSETVYQEVEFGPKSLGYDEEDVEDLVRSSLELVGLWELKDRSPWSLSGGEKKRLSIAAVLSMNTKYLAIDEPTIGQDHVSQINLVKIFRSIKAEGRSIIVVSHDLEWLLDLRPDVVIIMRGGFVVRIGDVDLLYNVKELSSNRIVPPVEAVVKSLIGDSYD